jgi:transcriptional regulator with XRE-family HTH domain
MQTTGEIIRLNREKQGLLLKDVAKKTKIDIATLSKIERNERAASKTQILRFAELLYLNKNDLLVHFLSEKIANQIASEDIACRTLKEALKKVRYIQLKNLRK